MGYLSRDELLAAQGGELRREAVEVPELGGTVLVRELTALEITSIGLDAGQRLRGRESVELSEISNLFPTIVSFGLIDETGKRVLTVPEVRQFKAKHAQAISRIAGKILEISDLATMGGDGATPKNG